MAGLEGLDVLPTYCTKRVLVLGVGNVLFGDDGFGPAAVARLAQDHEVPDDVYVMDVGTGVRKLLFTLALSEALPEEIIVLDAVDGGRGDGRLGEVALDDLPVAKLDDFSLHQVPTSNLLRELRERGVAVTILACDVNHVPSSIEVGLSPATEQAVAEASAMLAARLGLPALSD